MNKIQNIIRARCAGFEAKITEIKELNHSGTNGDLRELILKELVTSVLPEQFSIRSGFICDAVGGVSNQLDLIIIDRSQTPALLLLEDVAFIPIEAALAVVEIKATIKTGKEGTYEQMKKQVASVVSLKPVIMQSEATDPAANTSAFKVPFLLFGFSSDVQKATLANWLQESNDLNGVCVYQREYQWKDQSTGVTVKQADGVHSEMLIFLSTILGAVEHISLLRSNVPRNSNVYIEGYPAGN